jgi:hypothetical protein
MEFRLKGAQFKGYQVGDKEVPHWIKSDARICGNPVGDEGLAVRTSFGPKVAEPGDYVLLDLFSGEITTVDKESFEDQYEATTPKVRRRVGKKSAKEEDPSDGEEPPKEDE